MGDLDQLAGQHPRFEWPVGTEVQARIYNGDPVAKGSMRGFVVGGKDGAPARAIVTDNKSKALKSWDKEVRMRFGAAMQGQGLAMMKKQPCEVQVVFFMTRPEGQLDKAGKPRESAPSAPSVKPDIDKLLRMILDSITKVAFDDDSRVVRVVTEKRYVDKVDDAGALVRVIAVPPTVGDQRRKEQKQLLINLKGESK